MGSNGFEQRKGGVVARQPGGGSFLRVSEEAWGSFFCNPKRPRDAADRRKRGALETLASILVRRL